MEVEPGIVGPSALRPVRTGAGVPLFHAACLFALGIVLAHFVWLRTAYLLIALLPIGLLSGIAALRSQRIVWVPLAVLWCLLGAWCAEMQPQPAAEPAIVALSDGLLRSVEGTITDAAPVRRHLEENAGETENIVPTQRLDIALSNIEVVTDDQDVQAAIHGNVRLTVRWPEGESAATGFHLR